VRRVAFIASATAWAYCAGRAEATGGRDVDNPVAAHEMRVLLASDPGRTPDAQPVDANQFRWNGRMYRGRFEGTPLSDGRYGLVNVVPLDAYLYGVLSKEVGAAWPPAAQQAQAIVARTYALTKQRPGKPYDVLAGESDQVYGGVEAETVEGRDAVDATAGSVVVYENVPAHVAFGSCCGGHTADSGDVWGRSFPYLRGVVDPHCAMSPEFHWQRDVPYDEFMRALGVATAATGDVERVDLIDIDESGRPRSISLVGARGTTELRASAFRSAIGTTVVRSTLIQNVQIQRNGGSGTVSIAGAGRGHGVGLCQWGARGMASEGTSAEQIVQFYFPSTSLGRA